jgi:hypothetical protein
MFFSTFGFAQEPLNPIQNLDPFAYMFIGSNHNYIWCNISDEDAAKLRKKNQGVFLWYEENGNGYLLNDPKALSKLDQLCQEREVIYANDPNLPKDPKICIQYTSSEATLIKLRENMNVFEAYCKQVIKAGLAIPMSRQDLFK